MEHCLEPGAHSCRTEWKPKPSGFKTILEKTIEDKRIYRHCFKEKHDLENLLNTPNCKNLERNTSKRLFHKYSISYTLP